MRIPDQYAALLERSRPLEAATLTFVEAVAVTLEDNKTPFFPAYTDHGVRHVEGVLDAIVRLLPDSAWELFEAEDAAAVICGAALHDIAMHLREDQFVALVTQGPGVRSWFAASTADRPGDVPWPDLWHAFRVEAQHMGAGQLETILGPGFTGTPGVAYDPTPRPARWVDADRLLIGEFVRRHHARIAHEIALDGWPGLSQDQFPVLADLMPGLADAVGLIARSHNEDLRSMIDYCEAAQGKSFRPWGALVPLAMALLRIADYLQIDADRAPPVLLHLKAPASQISLDEWNKHAAVARVVWEGQDPNAIYVRAGAQLTLRSYTQALALLRALQRELDVTWSVLDEVYADERFRAVRLAYRRVRSNFGEAVVTEQLPFAPVEAQLHTDPDLFRLVVAPLYGEHPEVAVRELVQNAVDAVRQLHLRRGTVVSPTEPEVVVRLEELDEQRVRLRVTDCGIGMTPETVRDYFLAAGATLGPDPEAFDEATTEQRTAWLKTGRFGIGVFAAFLLADEITVSTRHVDSARGVTFVVGNNSEPVELRWCDGLPVGTSVEATVDRARLERRHRYRSGWGFHIGNFIDTFAVYYRWSDPPAVVEYDSPSLSRELKERERRYGGLLRFANLDFPGDVPSRPDVLGVGWRSVEVPEFDSVLWERSSNDRVGGQVVHNGFLLKGYWEWHDERLEEIVAEPRVAVVDSRHRLSFDLTRSDLLGGSIPFDSELLVSIGGDLCRWSQDWPGRPYPGLRGWAREFVVGRAGWAPFLSEVLATSGAERMYVLWDENWRDMPVWHDRFIAPGVIPDGELRLVLPIGVSEHMNTTVGAVHFGFGEDGPTGEDRMFPELITQCVGQLEWMSDWTHSATLVRAWGRDVSQFSLGRSPASGWSRERPDGSAERRFVYRGAARRVDLQAKRALTACLDAVARGRSGIAAISVFEPDGGRPVERTELGRAWTEEIGGLLPLDDRAADAFEARHQAERDMRKSADRR